MRDLAIDFTFHQAEGSGVNLNLSYLGDGLTGNSFEDRGDSGVCLASADGASARCGNGFGDLYGQCEDSSLYHTVYTVCLNFELPLVTKLLSYEHIEWYPYLLELYSANTEEEYTTLVGMWELTHEHLV